jgi:hypothetical protein
MKFSTLFAAAGLMVAAIGTSAPAEAQYRGDYSRHYDRHDDRGRHHVSDRGRHRGWNQGRPRARHGHGYRQRCWTEWRRHHRVRVCR